jgi:ABC-type transport system involved in cytochrome c biogenesis permease subunit
MIGLLHATALLCYGTAAAMMGMAFRSSGGRDAGARAGIGVAIAGVIAHAGGLVAYARFFGELPLVGLAPSLSTLGFIIVVFLLLSAVPADARSLLLIVLPIVACVVLIGLILGLHPTDQTTKFGGAWFVLHVLFAFGGFAGLTVSAAAGLLYLLQFRALKAKHLGRIFRFFPALPTLDRMGKAGLLIGFPSLTVGLLVGWGWSMRFQQALSIEEAQVIWGVVTWIVFALIAGVRVPGRAARERRGALASVIGFVVVVLAYVLLRVSPAARGGFL